MNNDMKCPVCKKELRPLAIGWCCDCGMCGDKELWQELIRTRKALDVAKDTFNWIDETYRTGQETEAGIWGKVQLAAQEITALEQKE